MSGMDNSNFLVMLTVFIGAFFLVRGVLYLLQSYARSRAAHNAGATLSNRLFAGYLALPYAFHLRRNSSELIRNTQYAVMELVQNAFIPIVTIASESLLVISILGALIATAPVVTIFVVALLGPIVLALMRLLQPRLQSLGETSQEMAASNVKILQQSFEGVRDIKLTGRRAFFADEFARSRSALATSLYRKEVLQDVPRVVVETAIVGFILGFIGISVTVGGGVLRSVPVLGLFAYAVFRVLPSLNRVLASANSLRFGFAAIDHVYTDLIAIEEVRAPSEDGRPATELSFTQHIRLSGVTFRYENAARPAVEDIDLSVDRGESVGFVGATGSGKSTLIDLVIGLLEATTGGVLVDEVDIRTNLVGWHAQIGMVPQRVFLLDDTLRRNIAFGIADEDIEPDAITDSVELAQLGEFVASLPDGLETVVGERGVRLSGGQMQRVAIARALYRRPQVLVFDEGTSALDRVTESRLMRALATLRGDRTLLIVAHRLATVRECDRIVLLSGGRIMDIGSYEDLNRRSLQFRELAT